MIGLLAHLVLRYDAADDDAADDDAATGGLDMTRRIYRCASLTWSNGESVPLHHVPQLVRRIECWRTLCWPMPSPEHGVDLLVAFLH